MIKIKEYLSNKIDVFTEKWRLLYNEQIFRDSKVRYDLIDVQIFYVHSLDLVLADEFKDYNDFRNYLNSQLDTKYALTALDILYDLDKLFKRDRLENGNKRLKW